VIGDRQRLVPQFDGPLDQLARMGSAVEERRVRVTVQLGIPLRHDLSLSNMCSI